MSINNVCKKSKKIVHLLKRYSKNLQQQKLNQTQLWDFLIKNRFKEFSPPEALERYFSFNYPDYQRQAIVQAKLH